MKKKSMLPFLLVLAMLLGMMAGCGSQAPAASAAESAGSVQASAEEAPAEEAVAAEAGTEEES